MTFEKKAEIVISQLREDRDRLQNTIEQIRAEIESINLNEVATKYDDRFYGFQQETLAILDKYKAESEE